jgi:5-methylcytosine-specific restriction endonuclease McrA
MRMGSTGRRWPYSTSQWRRVRMQVLERDRFTCRIGLPGCRVKATEADHIVSLANGGEAFNPENLRAACKPCNVARNNSGKRKGATGASASPSTLFAPASTWH